MHNFPQWVLHGSWSGGVFFLWAESSERAPRARGRRPRVPLHPHAASVQALYQALSRLSSPERWADHVTPTHRAILLPSSAHGPLSPPWLIGSDERAEPRSEADPNLAPWKVPGLALEPLAALDVLVMLPSAETDGRWLGSDLRFWGLAAKLCVELLAHHKYLPALAQEGGRYRAFWLLVLTDVSDQERLSALARAMPPVCRALSSTDDPSSMDDVSSPLDLIDSCLQTWTDLAVRAWGQPKAGRGQARLKGVAGAWWSALWDVDPWIKALASQRAELARLSEAHGRWIDQLRSQGEQPFRLCFRLEPPEMPPETGHASPNQWTLRYLLQATDDPSLLVPAEEVWRARGKTLHYLRHRFEGAQERLLSGLGLATRVFPPIAASLRTARPESCPLSIDDAYAFLREVGPLLESSGFGVLVPPWWNKPNARLGVHAKVKAGDRVPGKGILTRDSLIEFEWQLALGGELLTREEFERLAALKTPLVQIRGHWVLLQPKDVEAAISFWEKKRQEHLGMTDALQIALGATPESIGLPVDDVQVTGWLADLAQQLGAGERAQDLPPPDGLHGQLRPYQQRGYSWLAFLRRWGLGACLADDMGLGKTIQAICLLLHERQSPNGRPAQQYSEPALVVCPTSVVGNWKREVTRFAPSLRVMVHHGSDRAREAELVSVAQQHDVVISTYGLVRRDLEALSQVEWSDVILDEAQNIKNPHAKQTQAVRSLHAASHIALTGTPVENRLSELWSIMQFLNPGLLGSEARFHRRFALPIERYQDQAATQHLQRIVTPFILRRVKTDPAVIQDLPDKLEFIVYCSLTAEQATLYQAVVNDSLQQIDSAPPEGIERRGIVLGVLTRLKQVCNHPAQFLADGSPLPGRSGKLDRLGEMLEEALEVGDRALVFTQYAEMGHMLQAHLQSLFGVEVLFLHGGIPQSQRDHMVDRFQQGPGSPPILVLSLKAGGTGLNLTAANRVFHFDRWWNPAVENQATDRAFRIGQTRDVHVHKLVCAGTLEERIDQLIESKIALAASVIGAGESWLAELSTDELRSILVLREP